MLPVLSSRAVLVQEQDYPTSQLFIRNPPLMDNVADLTQLSYMHEPGLLFVLAERYSR